MSSIKKNDKSKNIAFGKTMLKNIAFGEVVLP